MIIRLVVCVCMLLLCAVSSAYAEKAKGEVSDEPVFIKSKTLSLNAKKRVFSYNDDVEVTQGDMIVTADAVIGTYDKDNQLKSLVCDDNVVITKGLDLRASAERARYDVKRGVVELTEAPELYRQGNVLTADKITVYVNEDRSEAEGEVRVKVLQPEQNAAALDSLKGAGGGN